MTRSMASVGIAFTGVLSASAVVKEFRDRPCRMSAPEFRTRGQAYLRRLLWWPGHARGVVAALGPACGHVPTRLGVPNLSRFAVHRVRESLPREISGVRPRWAQMAAGEHRSRVQFRAAKQTRNQVLEELSHVPSWEFTCSGSRYNSVRQLRASYFTGFRSL